MVCGSIERPARTPSLTCDHPVEYCKVHIDQWIVHAIDYHQYMTEGEDVGV